MVTLHRRLPDFDSVRPSHSTVLWWSLLITTELVLLLAYAVFGPSELISPWAGRYWLYPLVWINVALWAILRTEPAPTSTRHVRTAALLAVVYFGVLAFAGGLIGPGGGNTGWRIVLTSIPPGWAPAFLYSGSTISLAVIPFKLAGYVALAYLVYATILDAAGSAVTGLLGLLSCVSCSWPIIVSLVTGAVGGGTGVTAAFYTQSYGLSTAVFVVTVGLLYWRPFGR